MATKYEEPFKDTLELFNGVIAGRDLDILINIKILTDNKLKTVTKLKKADDLVKFETGKDLYIFVNEQIFEQLEEWQQLIVVEESIAGVYFNSEKDKLEIKKGDVATFSGLLRQYGYDNYENVTESIKTLYSVEKENAEA